MNQKTVCERTAFFVSVYKRKKACDTIKKRHRKEMTAMLFEQKTRMMKDGRECVLASPDPKDAKSMLDYLKTCAEETDNILRYPEECDESNEQEETFLRNINESQYNVMIVCKVDGDIAGNCTLTLNKRLKIKHRASVAIALKRKYWNLGIGTMMFEEMEKIAREKNVLQLELGFVGGNDRARILYEKRGFVKTGKKPDAFYLKDGSFRDEILMIKKL